MLLLNEFNVQLLAATVIQQTFLVAYPAEKAFN